MNWEDATGYSQGERGKIQPRTYTCRVACTSVILTITRKHIRYTEFSEFGWMMILAGHEAVRWRSLGEHDADKAKTKAVKAATSHLCALQMDIAAAVDAMRATT